jgi:hypothetical protein
VPEIAEVWTGIRAAIEQKSVALSLRGFGCARLDSTE